MNVVNIRRLLLTAGGVFTVLVGVRLASLWATSASLLSVLETRPVAIVDTDCSVTPTVREFAEERSVMGVPTDHDTELGRTLCELVFRDLGMRGRVIVALRGRRSACESLATEARTRADGHDSPMFIGPDGEAEATKQAYREFQLQKRLRFLRE